MRAEIKRDCAGTIQRESASDRARRCCKVMSEMENNEARNSKRRGVIPSVTQRRARMPCARLDIGRIKTAAHNAHFQSPRQISMSGGVIRVNSKGLF